MPSFPARLTATLLASFLAAPSAFSADAPGETTSPPDLPTTVVTPYRDPAKPPAPAAREPIGEGPAPHVALILPIASKLLGAVADAVRQGFFAAAEVAGGSAVPVRMYATADDGPAVLETCRKAQKEGAVLVIAGITRDGATGLARSDCPRQPTLALNQPQEAQLPARMYAISLAVEQEARQAALLAINDGLTSAVVITAPSALSQRVHEAFESEWRRAAGESRRLVFAGAPEDAPVVKEKLAALGGDMVFLALDRATARAVRPYVSGSLPIYATSYSIDPRADAAVNVDLEGVRYVDMPWFVQPDHPAVMVYPAPGSAMSVEQERLYALGIDAYRLGVMLLQAGSRPLALDGVTGRITLDAGRHFARTLVPAAIDAGHAVALPPAR